MVRRIAVVGLVLLFVVAANRPEERVAKVKPERIAADDESGDISGYYVCKGKESSGKTYSGVAVVTRQREVYLIQWMIGAGATFTGIGVRQGNTLSASWVIPGDKLVRGVNVYKIESGPRLVGRWASIPGPGIVQHETLTFLKKMDENEE